MSALTQITITFLTFTSASPSVMSTASVSIPVPAGVAALDSVGNQNASAQIGYSAFDLMLASIAKGGGVRFVDTGGIATWIPLQQITKIQGE